MNKKVIIIGAGAAGTMAGIFSAGQGNRVYIYEKNPKIGRKLYISGKGRCNLTNNCDINTFIANTVTNGRFLYSALIRFSPQDTISFFESHGLHLKTERGNRVFPVSDRSSDVIDTLFFTAKKSGCVFVNKNVDDIITENGSIKGIIADGEAIECDKLIVACGGLSYPLTGSTGDGYRFAKKAGHTIVTPKPSLVPLETIEKPDYSARGLLLKNVSVTFTDTKKKKKLYSSLGEIQLMSYGVSGALTLSASSYMREMESGRYRIQIDLKPALDREKLDKRILREISENPRQDCRQLLRSMLPGELVTDFIKASGIDGDKPCCEMSRADRIKIAEVMKSYTLTVKGFRPIEEAIVTSGGVSVREIDPKTMQSKLCKGLYFAGEVMDIDCLTGGFNIQAAFSTAVLAAEG